jgi:hypothetical protein
MFPIGDDEVIAVLQIFGADEAKGKVEKRLEHEGLRTHILAVETVDKMTDCQIAAKVRRRSRREYPVKNEG